MKRMIILALVCATPATAQETSDYDRAVAARVADRPAEAVKLLSRWLRSRPSDSDALVQRGYAYLALGEHARAEADFRAVLALAPGYTDAQAGLDLALARQEDPDTTSYIRVEGAWSDLKAQRDWWEFAFEAQSEVSNKVTLGGKAQLFRRFGLEDIELSGRVIARASDDLWLRATVGATPSAQFRPEVTVAAGGDYRLVDGQQATILTFDGSYQRFPGQDVVILSPGIVQYLADGSAWLTVRGIGAVVDGGTIEVGASARMDFMSGEQQRIFGGLAHGPDTDLGEVTRVTSLFAGGTLPINSVLAFEPSLAHEWRESGEQRTEVRVGLKAAF